MVWVLSGAPLSEVDPVPAWLPRPDKIVVADGGSALAERLDLTPDLVIGDLDSAEVGLLARWNARGVPFRTYVHEEKVETDTELAALAALEWQPERIVILGALGGRLDHGLANVLLLTHRGLAGADVSIVEGNQEIYLAKPGSSNPIRGRAGDTVSLSTPWRRCDRNYPRWAGVSPQRGEPLSGIGPGISNVLTRSEGRVRYASGLLLVVVVHLLPDSI